MTDGTLVESVLQLDGARTDTPVQAEDTEKRALSCVVQLKRVIAAYVPPLLGLDETMVIEVGAHRTSEQLLVAEPLAAQHQTVALKTHRQAHVMMFGDKLL